MSFVMNDRNSANFLKDAKYDSCGRRTDCYFYKNVNGRVGCRALTDFYNVEDSENQCGKCPFYKTETEFKSGWNGGFYDDEEELEEVV